MKVSSSYFTRTANRPWQRIAVLVAVIALHLGLFALLLLSQQARGHKVITEAVPTVIADLNSPAKNAGKPRARRAATRPAEPVPPPVPAAPVALPASVAAPAATAGDPAAATAGGGCDLASHLRDAILSDEPAMGALAALQGEARTAADAVMLWDGKWLGDDSSTLAAQLAPLRAVIDQALKSATPQCAAATMTGPQFIAIPAAGRTTMLVIGSGQWRWRDLFPPEPTLCGIGMPACPSPTPPHNTGAARRPMPQ